jgi:L-ascorbate metabolism protein UlaG (beta-lactamase superfamily)
MVRLTVVNISGILTQSKLTILSKGGQHHRKKVVNIAGLGGQDGSEYTHTSPSDAARAFREMEGKFFIPMHFGTFDLSDELLLEPLDWLKAHPDSIHNQLINPVLGRNLFE